MSQAHDLIKGLRSTQSSVVFVHFEAVANLVGQDIAEHLATNISSFSQTAHKPNMPSKEAIQKAEMRKPHNIGAFDRADLLSVIDELIREKGGLEALIEEADDTRSPLQKAREELGNTIPFPQKRKSEKKVSKKEEEDV